MQTPSFLEDHISQIPALQMLVNLGYTYLNPAEALQMRGGKTTNVLLEDILRKQLKEMNSIKVSTAKASIFTDENIERGIQILKNMPMNDGYIATCEKAYNLLTLGTALEQSIDGEKKSFTLQYIDWKNIDNNVFHVTEEYSVMRATSKEYYRPDLVLFVNGIPFCIIECKRPDMKEPIKQAISQHLRNQQEDGIRNLYVYSQILLSIAAQDALYATNATLEKFWSKWKEEFSKDDEEVHYKGKLEDRKNANLSNEVKDKIFSDRYKYVRKYFDALREERILPTEQDVYLYGLCRPKRLLDLIFNFIVFDNGQKKIARYQQYFAIKKTMKRLKNIENGKRNGGVIWHTQGSGKSLTMVMLAQAIALEPGIRNPKIILVTDRTDLDEQITDTFKKCGKYVENATTGQRLIELLQRESDAVVTTIINKFNAAINKIYKPLTSPNIFVLVDEGHRSQHGVFNIDMQKTLPNACFIAMTGTPLFKKEKSTAEKFGGIIDAYTVGQAVKDNAVVPLLYEGRLAIQDVNESPVDTFFGMISEPLNDKQKSDLKKKFARADQLNSAEQKMYAIAWNISDHFKNNWQGTPFKAQLVCDKKISAIKYKEFLDEIGIVTSEVLISSIDEREGEDSAFEKSTEKENAFWLKMMNEHGNKDRYEKNIINRFKNQKDPEIIIVVDKLLTGFDEPKNTVLYLTRNLQNHKLLQAVARVNRIYPDKEFGYIIDYYGVIKNLDTAMQMYSTFEDFDQEDLNGTLTKIASEIEKLPQKHSELWDIFKTIINKRDAEGYQQLLRDEAVRVQFYDKLADYAKTLKLALSSIQFHKQTEEKIIKEYKDDLAFFLKLRVAVIERYSDEIDYKQYEGQIQKLIDTHITTVKIENITELVNIFDKDKFAQEIEKTVGTKAKADKIASRTAKHITEKMDEDPAFYKKFSRMLQETIKDYEEKRISEAQYLSKVQEVMNNVLTRTDDNIPLQLANKDVAKAFYGIIDENLSKYELEKNIITDSALAIDEIVLGFIKVDWQKDSDAIRRMNFQIGEYLIDEVKEKYNIELSFEIIDGVAEQCVEVAKVRYKG
jgi:type I restriction enzyme R subunit